MILLPVACGHVIAALLLGAAPTCPADLDGGGSIDGADIGVLLAAWGQEGESLSAADLNDDGMVDGADLGLLLGAWGPCPATSCVQSDWLAGFTVPGVGNDAHATALFDDGSGVALYVSGALASAGGLAVPSHVARWDGTTWSGLPGDLDNTVLDLLVHDDGTGPSLYAAGTIASIDDIPYGRIARWDGAAWSTLAGGLGSTVYALASFDHGSGPALYAGGAFTTADGLPASRIAKWDGSAWSPLGDGVNGTVYALHVHDDGSGPTLYVGGDFTTAGGVPANRIARWDGVAWSAVGEGVNGQVRSLASVGDEVPTASGLVVGGLFSTAGATPALRIARWSDGQWSALGGGFANGSVDSLEVFDDGAGPQLYAGGIFTGRIARWDGVAWNPLPALPSGGTNGVVDELIVFDEGRGNGPALFASGEFTTIGGVKVNYIGRFDGLGWSAIGNGITGSAFPGFFVYDLEYFDDGRGDGPVLFATGLFTHAGGVPAANIARWDGDRWEALGSGLTDRGYALEVFDDGTGPALYVGGEFTQAGGAPAKRIAKWDGSTWSPLGGGVEGGFSSSVYALSVFDAGQGPQLFVAGSFATAGGLASLGLARWDSGGWSADSIGGGLASLRVLDDVVTGVPTLYAGTSGAIGINDGSGWKLALLGLNGIVYDFERFDGGNGPKLVIGGTFIKIGEVSALRVAQWDGVEWAPLAGGMTGLSDSAVFTLALFDDGNGPRLHAGGAFRYAGGQLATNYAAWDGAAWHTIGAGVGEPLASNSLQRVYRLKPTPDSSAGPPALLCGGTFPIVDGKPAANFAIRGCAE